MNLKYIRSACASLDYSEPISIEPDGVVWFGTDDARTYLTAAQQKAVEAKADELEAAPIAAKKSAHTKLAALGLTPAEIAAL